MLLRFAIIGFTCLSTGCALINGMVANTAGKFFGSAEAVYASDEDPELVRDALPFSLKTMETLLDSSPENKNILLGACSGFTIYAYLFLQADAEMAEWDDYNLALELRERARKMYVRGRDYCLRRLDVTYPGIGSQLLWDPTVAVLDIELDDVETLYWLGTSWGLAISNGLDHPELIADLPAVKALLGRAIELDEDYNRGAIHSALIPLEAWPEEMGGSPSRARQHFERAVELSDGLDASVYVTFAAVARGADDREEFERLLKDALAVDPDEDKSYRLLNLISQKLARDLLDHLDDLFFE